MDLPEELIAEIISRTPVRTIVSCKSVCKRWCNIVSEPFFSRLHLSISSKMLLLHQGDAEDVDDDNDGDLAVVELDDQHRQHDIHHEPMMRFSPGLALGDYVGLIGSVNGLICLEDSYDDSAYVCNPITQEYIRLQDSEYTRVSYLKGYYGFGLVESNQQYKIVRFYKGRFPSTEYDLGSEVYTLGTGMWRDLGHVPFHLNEHDRGHYVSGRLHWLAGELICAFDLDRELFRPMEAPPRAPGNTDHFSILGVHNHFRNLGVLKGCLCICDITLYSELSIWVKRDYGVEDSWSKKLIITPNPPLHEGINTDMVRLLKVLKDGNILMYCDQLQLFTYHPQHKTLRHHIFPEGEFLTFGAMTYVPGFISLERSFTLEGVKRWESPQVED
ncbi:F-box protein At3g07870-like [Apium graveolens]|uniref:F-box protein At3g07870-like n=1 Tax=Apium graveolens TaxID=4045 RepID=UPI003D79148C